MNYSLRDLKRMAKAAVIGNDEFICSFQSKDDIKRQLRRAEYDSRSFAKKLRPFFNSDDKRKVCKRVWTFMRIYIDYNAEPKEKQTAKTIPKFLIDKKGDCKHYSVFSVGTLRACGVPSWFAVVRQTGDKTKWHIYACAYVNGKVVIVDPCRKVFNSECRYVKKFNVPPIKK